MKNLTDRLSRVTGEDVVDALWAVMLAFLALSAIAYLFAVVDWLGVQAGIERSWFTELGKGTIVIYSVAAAFTVLFRTGRR